MVLHKNVMIHETAVIDEGCEIGQGSTIWHFTHLMSGCKIGEKCNLGQNVMIASGVILGNNVKIQNNVSIYQGVICEDDVFIAPSVVFTNISNPRSAIIRKHLYKKTIIKKGATIGANSTIICGLEIGEYAFIGAGAVVTHNVEPYSIVVGVPAMHMGWISEYGHRLSFGVDGMAVCPESKEKYRFDDGRVLKIINKSKK